MLFKDLNIIEPIQKDLTEAGYTNPTPIQELEELEIVVQQYHYVMLMKKAQLMILKKQQEKYSCNEEC